MGALHAQGADAGARPDLPRGHPASRVLLRQEHHPPADGQDARLHDHHRRDEERVRRAAQREAPLDARRDPRDGGRPAGDPAGDPLRAVRRDGRHLRRRRAGPARDALAREGHPAGLGRPGGDRRGLGEAAGLQPDGPEVHPAGRTSSGWASAIRRRSRSSATTSRRRTGASSRKTPSPAGARS